MPYALISLLILGRGRVVTYELVIDLILTVLLGLRLFRAVASSLSQDLSLIHI